MEYIDEVPDPPTVGQITHHSIELFFDAVSVDHSSENTIKSPRQQNGIKYIVQEEELGGLLTKGYGTVYSGFARRNTFTGLEPRTTYRYRLKRKHLNEESLWSRCVEVTTTNKPPSADDLHKAVQKNDLKMVEKLLKVLHKELVDAPDKYGYTPLMTAAFKGCKEVASLLLEHFADVNYQNSSGKSALMMACYAGYLPLVQLLRSSGATWSVCDHSGLSPLHWAVDGGNIDMIRWMIKDGCQVDCKEHTSGWTPLMRLSSMKGDASLARILLLNGADLNTVDKSRKSPLMMAALNGHTDLVQLYLSEGAKVNKLSVHNKTALDFARSFKHRRIIELLEQRASEEKSRKSSYEKTQIVRPLQPVLL